MTRSRASTVLALVALGALPACVPAGDFGTGTVAGPAGADTAAASLAVSSGNNQSAAVNTPLASPLVVRATNSSGDPLPGVQIDWSVPSGGGAVSATSSITDDQGLAQVDLTLGAATGIVTVSATIHNTEFSVAFTITATAETGGAPTSISVVSGDGQSATAGSPLTDPLVVRVRDAGSQNVPGVTVRWTVTQGGGSLDSATSVTDGQGLASSRLTLGDSTGPHVATAAVVADTSLQATFTATATAVPATADVTVSDDVFTPAAASVQAGGVVTWTWAAGASIHNITWVSGGFPNASDRSTGTHQVTFGTAGTFNYYCSIHGTPTTGMRGSVTVSD